MKKTIITIVSLAIGAILFTSCDKIESDQYIVFAGATGQWYDGDGVADHTKRAFIEKYTGVRCNNCPNADMAIATAKEQYGEQLIAVSIHDSNALQTPIGDSPDMRSADGNAWSKALGVYSAGEYPSALASRKPSGSGGERFNPVSGVNSQVDEILGEAAQVALSVAAVRNDGKVRITVNVEYLQDVADGQTLTLLLMEDGIVATQKMPNFQDSVGYVHNHIMRDVITDLWGADIDADGKTGTKRMCEFVYGEFSPTWNLDRCHIVALVSDKNSRKVLNCAECEIQ